MNVVAINGSPRAGGNTALALSWMTDELERQGIATQTVQIGQLALHGCIACNYSNT